MQWSRISDRNVTVYTFSQTLHAMAFLIPVWIAYYQKFLSSAEISYLIAFQFIVGVVGELPTGALADLIGRRWTMLISYVIGAVSFCMLPLAHDFFGFATIIFALGIADSLASGSGEALVYDSLKQDNRESEYSARMSRQSAWYQFGLITATLAGGFLYQLTPTLPFILYGILLGVAAVSSLFFIEPVIDSETFTLRNYLKQMRDGAREAFKNPNISALSLFYIFVGGITWTTALYFNDFLLVDLGFPDAQRGVIAGTIRIFNVTLLTKLLKNQHIFTDRVSVFFFPIVMTLAYLPIMFLDGWAGVPFLALSMLAATARWIVLSRLTNLAFSSKYRATAISTLSLCIGIICIILSAVSGPIMQAFGDVRSVYMVLGIVSIATVVPLSVRLSKTEQFDRARHA